jgi:hypothetical protein
MEIYLYLTATPEALIASMLPPEEFGSYLAIGSEKRTRGQAIYFEVDMEQIRDQLPTDYILQKCVPTFENRPKRSVYITIYRVIENIPLTALKDLYLATDDGRVLGLKQANYTSNEDDLGLHLYQELMPVTPRVVSSLDPKEFMMYMTGQVDYIRIPKLFFVELELGGLASDPVNGSVNNLPYPNIEHLKDCLIQLKYEPQKIKKTVIRFFYGNLLYRTCKNGFFIGSGKEFLYYPIPSEDELEDKYYSWWRSASILSFE